MTRRTPQKAAIERAILEARRPLGPREILAAARVLRPGLSLSTVYRALKRLQAEGTVVTVELPGAPARYELQHVADEHHHHFLCTACDAVFDLSGCVEGLRNLLPVGFELTGHDVLLTGHCKRCSDR